MLPVSQLYFDRSVVINDVKVRSRAASESRRSVGKGELSVKGKIASVDTLHTMSQAEMLCAHTRNGRSVDVEPLQATSLQQV